MIVKGQKMRTDFELKVVRHGVDKLIKFNELLDRRTVVSVYMKNNTPSCDRQNDALATHAEEIAAMDYNLVALSRDTCGSHRKYAVKKGITYTLASDPDDVFAKAVGSVIEKSMYGRTFFGPARAAYVIDVDGTVLAVIEKVDTADHAAQLLTVLRSL